ncbi:DotU family type IV/VI secretion system protein [Neisseriaceae bacterium TC5R-5]|nr:DotU family type IV/VI secretion system protein [Neisseriaceae bacterium TC5R-5]
MISLEKQQQIQLYFEGTVLHIALLAKGSLVPSVATWRSRCIDLVKQLRADLESAGFSADQVGDISLVQCVLLDAAANHFVDAGQQYEWNSQRLERFFFNRVDGTEVVLKNIELALRQHKNSQLAYCYRLLLELDLGRFLRREKQAHDLLLQLKGSIELTEGGQVENVVPLVVQNKREVKNGVVLSRKRDVVLLSTLLLCVVVLLVIWAGWYWTVDLALAESNQSAARL